MNDSLIAFGGSVKALPDGRLGGMLVRYGSPSERDVHDEFFTQETDFLDPPLAVPSLYHHGWTKALGNRPIGRAELSRTPEGIAVTATLYPAGDGPKQIPSRHRDKILADVQADKLGWSSGSADHLVNVEKTGRILQWPIVEATISPAPADRRNRVMSLKAVKALAIEGEDGTATLDPDWWPRTLEDLSTFVHSVKAGRVISASNWERLKRLYDALGTGRDDLGELLNSTAIPDANGFGLGDAMAQAYAAKANASAVPVVPTPSLSTTEEKAAALAELGKVVRRYQRG
jgi:hypothetical protein